MSIIELTKKYKLLLTKKPVPDDELEEFETINRKELNRINNRIMRCSEMFNGLMSEIGDLLKRECPYDAKMSIYSGVVNNFRETKSIQPLLFFITNIYCNDTYRKHINEGNESFFLGNSYDELGNDKNSVNMIFQFKSCWGKLTDKNKIYIKEAMKTLIRIGTQYIEEKDNGNQLTIMMLELQKINS